MHSLKTHLSALFISISLVACGGGGSSTTTTTTTPTTTTQTTTDTTTGTTQTTTTDTTTGQTTTTTTNEAAIQSQVLAATYVTGTEQRDAYDYLNSQRQLCGFGLLQQAAGIDTAAQAHSDYILNNNLELTHYEDKTTYPNGFTGILPAHRLLAAGYSAIGSGAGSEVIVEPNVTYGSTFGKAGIMNLFLGPYHGYAMLRSDRDIGIGFTKNNFSSAMVIDFAWSTQRQKQMMSASQVETYPCNGVTGVLSQSYFDESPSPITGRNLQTNPIGHPIYVKVRDGNILALSTYVLRKAGTNIDLALQLLDKTHDPASIITDSSNAALIPLAPLEKNSSYLFTATGTNNGAAISISFTFNTGAY